MRLAPGIWVSISLLGLAGATCASQTRSVEIPIGKSGEVQVGQIVALLARAGGVAFDGPPAELSLSTLGLARGLTKTLLCETLGPEVSISFARARMVIAVDERILVPERRAEWQSRLRQLADRASDAARRRQLYGMRALNSFRPNDPARPTICLLHGLNSSSHGFVHMIPLLEEAGFGIVTYDYPFNRRLEESCAGFARDWTAFRRQVRDNRKWVIVAHSMGALLARALVEDDATWAGDVTSLILIAPVNHGSHLARVQTAFQLVNGLQAIHGKNTTQAMLHLTDGLGQAAEDLLPGSAFLNALNRRPPRPGLKYHILAGDSGFLTRDARRQYDDRLDLMLRNSGVLGYLTRAATADLPAMLDELTDGTGDGCVAVKRTRLKGVADHVTMHANHAELIRAPLLFPDPGPVACLPHVLRWLNEDLRRELTTAPADLHGKEE
jgi:pimeloyl-ACP methyl ester carboxylesterase